MRLPAKLLEFYVNLLEACTSPVKLLESYVNLLEACTSPVKLLEFYASLLEACASPHTHTHAAMRLPAEILKCYANLLEACASPHTDAHASTFTALHTPTYLLCQGVSTNTLIVILPRMLRFDASCQTLDMGAQALASIQGERRPLGAWLQAR